MEHDGSISCQICGIELHSGEGKRKHEITHTKTIGYKCSCCGSLQQTADIRNSHEKKSHNFARLPKDRQRKEAIKMRKSQLSDLYNVGFLLVEVQKTGCESAAQTNDPEATVEELSEIMNKKPQRPLSYLSCSICGRKYSFKKICQNLHIAKHHLQEGFMCSLCGVKDNCASYRNAHERRAHDFVRTEHRTSKEAVKISKEQLKNCKQVGTNFAEIQRSALPTTSTNEHSVLNSEPVQRPSKRSSAIEVVTLDSSDDEFQPQSTISVRESSPVVQRLNQSAPLSCSLKRVRLVEDNTLDDYNDDLLPESAIQTPQPTNSTSQLTTSIARLQSFLTTSQPTIQNRVNELMAEMLKNPQFLYYDYKAVGFEFSVLPVIIWKNNPNCELMVLRLDSANWNENITLESPFCYFNLNDEFGHFLGFAKPNSQLLADRFKGALSSVTSFKQLLECLHQMDFQSSLIITNELGRGSIRSFASERFVIF
ncbi:hypothetical protein M3Y98_00699100 [Aphelenchoides besseyi]|nr:hypothetical protein M3Y98_00699100 [Aphelenchoides besseyi]KAI6208908.1 hypothetical protein M3Y96_00164800 [Aphelenchoides besseyi]